MAGVQLIDRNDELCVLYEKVSCTVPVTLYYEMNDCVDEPLAAELQYTACTDMNCRVRLCTHMYDFVICNMRSSFGQLVAYAIHQLTLYAITAALVSTILSATAVPVPDQYTRHAMYTQTAAAYDCTTAVHDCCYCRQIFKTEHLKPVNWLYVQVKMI
jgi:hypothetical protein